MGIVFDQWVAEKRAEGQITPQSLTTYLGVMERDLRPAFGALRVREVTPVAVNRVLMALSSAQKFDTARQARNVLSQVMMMCVRYGAAPFNPVRDAVTVRKPRRAEVRTLGLEDIALLRKAVREWEDRPALPAVVAMSRCCRRSSTPCSAPACASVSAWRCGRRTSTSRPISRHSP